MWSDAEASGASALREALDRRLFLGRQVDFWLAEIDPTWSLRECRARIEGIVDESADAKTFVLRTNRRWGGFVAGQYLTLEVEIGGVRHRRCYSISSAPGGGRRLAITVKRVAGGLVSTWLHERARVGDVVVLGAAAGDFVLPAPLPAKLLFLSGGSGITPIASLLDDLSRRGGLGDAVAVHYDRTPEDAIFRRRLEELARRHRELRLHLRFTRGEAPSRRLCEAEIASLVPDFARRDAFVCGPPPLMEEVDRIWARHGIEHRLRRERFVAPGPAVADASGAAGAVGARVSLVRSGRAFESDGRGTLLEQVERAGVRAAFGCRMGICRTCTCRKRSGVVQNVHTGEISSRPDEDVRICVSVPRSDVELCI